MHFLFALLLISSVLSQVDPCNNASGTTCNGCTSMPNCGWCSSINACITGTLAGPVAEGLPVSTCAPKQWYFGLAAGAQHTCPICTVYSSCTDCTDQDACGWNANTQTCVAATTAGASPYCPCNEYTQCSDCRRGNCTFCACTFTNIEANGKCYPTPIPAGETCTSTLATCDCTQMKTCEICAEQEDICSWCPKTGSCMADRDEASCGQPLVTQCSVASTWSGGTFFGGIVLGLVLTLMVLGGLYAYRTYGSNQYSQVG